MRFHRKTAPRVVGGKVQRKNRWRMERNYKPTHQVRIDRFEPAAGRRHFISPSDVSVFLSLLPDWKELAIGLQRVRLSCLLDCAGWHMPGVVAICAWPEQGALVLTPKYYRDHADIFQRLKVPCRPIVMTPEFWCCTEDFPHDFDTGMSCIVCGDRITIKPRWYRLSDGADVVCNACGYDRSDLRPEEFESGFRPRARNEAPGYLAAFTDETVRDFQLLHILLHELGHHHDRMTSPRRRNATRGEAYAEAYARKYADAIWADYRRVFLSR